jgi:hypothetical protein
MEDTAGVAAYIDACCTLHDLPLTAEQRLRVIDTFARTATVVAPLLDFPLPAEIEAAAVFKA